MGIKAKVGQIKNLILKGREVDIQPVLVVATLDDEGNTDTHLEVAEQPTLTKSIIVPVSIVQTVQTWEWVITDISAWLGLSNKADLKNYRLDVYLHINKSEDIVGDDYVELYLDGLGGDTQGVVIEAVGKDRYSFPVRLFPCSDGVTHYNGLGVQAGEIGAGETWKFWVVVEAWKLPSGVASEHGTLPT